jgi:hypothetical protein
MPGCPCCKRGFLSSSCIKVRAWDWAGSRGSGGNMKAVYKIKVKYSIHKYCTDYKFVIYSRRDSVFNITKKTVFL